MAADLNVGAGSAGLLMATILTYIYGVPWQRFRHEVAAESWPRAEHSFRAEPLIAALAVARSVAASPPVPD